ncbi:hypothetical protein MNBD_GAMMA09-3500 [hydrothermal vent metagenome]|uniref:Uncharacterized protein n=1 Tax=hydrothermal vent metagenome TaxID=652676 RepID=A0A3B0XDE1_9ZZZZ
MSHVTFDYRYASKPVVCFGIYLCVGLDSHMLRDLYDSLGSLLFWLQVRV